MELRADIYAEVHKGLRAALTEILVDAGRLDVEDSDAVSDFNERLRSVAELLESHADYEDSYFHPLLDGTDDDLVKAFEDSHRELDAELSSAVEAYGSLADAEAEQALALGRQAYYRLAAFIGAYFVHISNEELEIMPRMQSRRSDAEIMEAVITLQANIPPVKMARFLAVMIPAMNVQERVAMFGGMKVAAPPEVLQKNSDLARTVLDDADWQDLSERVGL